LGSSFLDPDVSIIAVEVVFEFGLSYIFIVVIRVLLARGIIVSYVRTIG
jgi:hypothetical protein